MNVLILSLFSGLLSLFLTGLIRHYALNKQLIDIPNERSSHTVPTPRGGGLAIVFAFIVSLFGMIAIGQFEFQPLVGLIGASILVAAIGFVDDHRHIPARWRLLMHFFAAIWAIYWLGGFPPVPVFGFMFDLGWPGHFLVVIYLVWMLNLYNFMDGIDGIASVEAITVCFGAIMLSVLSPSLHIDWALPILLLATVSGFLLWNFPKAKIFMGDVGSGFIGVVLGILSIQYAWVSPELFWAWLILLGAFVVDATITLLRRIIRGEKFFLAHRCHAYQHMSRKLNAHSTVSIIYGLINLIWLLPIAGFVVLGMLDGVVGIVLAYSPLVIFSIYFNAGLEEIQNA